MYNNNMYAYRNMNGQMNNNGPQQIVLVEPYVYAALQSLIGKNAVLDTVRGSVGGTVIDVKPDHVVIQDRDSTFFVRLCQIVWIMPDTD
ncbi:MAG: YuzF family protein [Bacillaceae bacterium]|nr:YuzF family protein [Bacillaceae bacterium]